MDKTQTFAQLGIPFPLYEAPIETCSDFIGRGRCDVCARPKQLVFRASGELIVDCSNCGQANALACTFKEDGVCTACAAPIAWPLARKGETLVCTDCLREGRVYLNHDTAVGLLEWQDAQRGWVEFYKIDDLDPMIERQPVEGEPDYHRYEFTREDLIELGRTPTYSTWQGERWPFHCGRAMVYLGQPLSQSKSEVAPAIVAAVEKFVEDWDFEPWADEDSGVCIYLFRCQICGAYDGHNDCD